jgi:lysophospholipid hydrolase
MSSVVDLPAVTPAASLTTTLCSLAQCATSIAEQTLSAQARNGDAKTNMWGAFGRFVLLVLSIIPGILFWLITFTTITLPTWLFTFFSTSLTFTMNATTLCVFSRW